MSMANNETSPYFSRFARVFDCNDIQLDFLMLCKNPPTLAKDIEGSKSNVFWIPFSQSFKVWSYLVAILKGVLLLLKERPDILHVHLFDDAIPLLIAAKLTGVKSVITKLDAGFHVNHKPSFVRFDKWNNNLADHLVCVSQENKELVLKYEGVQESKISLVHQGFPIDEVIGSSQAIREELKKKFQLREELVLLSVGRFIPLKGYSTIIEALHMLKKEHDSALRAIFVGYGDHQSEYESLVKEKGLEDVVHFSGWINREELNNLYALCDIFVHGATVEPFGFVIAEAMANRIPVVSTNVGAARDAIEHGKSGFLSAPGSAEDMKNKILKAIKSDRKTIGENAYSTVERLFTIESMWTGHMNVYKKLLGE